MVWSIGMVLSDRLTVSGGGIAEASFGDAPIPSIADVPPMEIVLIETDAPPTGAGETFVGNPRKFRHFDFLLSPVQTWTT